MESKFKISISTPCHEDWSQMAATTTGRFCGSCTKNVVDFTAMMPVEIHDYFTANKGQNICGRFKKVQLETIVIEVPNTVLYSQMSFHKAFLMALFVAMGTSIFSCKDLSGNNQNIGEVVVVDTLSQNLVTKGILLPSKKDTIAVQAAPPPILKTSKKDVLKKNVVKEVLTTGAVELTEPQILEKSLTIEPQIMGMPAVEAVELTEPQLPEKTITKEPEIMGMPAVEEAPKSQE